jgi:hypothetical protein
MTILGHQEKRSAPAPQHGELDRGQRAAIAIALAIGAILLSFQYFAQRSLWHDELAIARNIEARSIAQLVSEPLAHSQAAPVGWLVAVKLATSVVGVNELGLRLVSWLAGLCSLILFWRVSDRFSSGVAQIAGVFLFSMGLGGIWHGAEAKQYSTDVAVVLLLILLALRFRERPHDPRRAVYAGAIGAVALLLSYPAVPVAFVLALCLFAVSWANRCSTVLRPLLSIYVGWGIGASLMSWLALHNLAPETRTYLHEFWAAGFPPSPGAALLVWPFRQLFEVVGHYLLFIDPPAELLLIPLLPLLLALLGVVFAWRRDPLLSAIALAPVAAGIAAAAIGLLPFRHRVALYTVPAVFILAGAALDTIAGAGRWGRRASFALAVVAVLPLALIVLLASPPPLPTQDSRYVLERVAAEAQEDDVLYAYCRAEHAVMYYGPRLGIDNWTVGRCDREDVDEIEALQGHPRVWFFFTQSGNGKAQRMRELFEARGVEEVAIDDRFGLTGESETAAYRYDLGDP